MGGNLIRDILEEGKLKAEKAKNIILVPAQNPEVLREYLYTKGYEIIKEDLCFEDGIFYELFKVKVNEKEKTELEDIYYEVSPLILRSKNPLMKDYLEEKIEKYNKIINLINDESESAKERKAFLNEKVSILENMIKYC